MTDLTYDTLLARREGLVRDLPPGDNEDLRWVMNAATLILGERDAVLVDTFTTIEQNERLIDWIRQHERNLTHIYCTHGHGDHTYGIGQLLEAFPGAQAVATPGAVAGARTQATDDWREGFWGRLFPGQIPVAVVPDELEGDHIPLEGHELRAVDTGHTDTEGTSVLWAPDAKLVVAGDVVYNNTHMYLAESDAASRAEWIAALRTIQTFGAERVVAAHKSPDRDDDPVVIQESIDYLLDVEEALSATSSAIEFYQAVLGRHPRRVNPGSLWGAAKVFKPSA
ncbi:MBL fold metallo-hydrolase [Peterkaempfera griseoplana]|uniref:MBL fold metallo-hydrolase n=1 Tax=Peterkaempfera griseoplana TaxID=66896 RepID=UPI0006E392F2|nr:MBL fold metallo-hydrolase [Peterkaempfera griseoplana]